MTGIENVSIVRAIVHKIGNPGRGEPLKLSMNPLTLNDTGVQQLLIRYFLSAVNENELYAFTHLHDVELNEVYSYVKEIFNGKDSFIPCSYKLAQFLYSKSTHVKIKDGELCVALLDLVPFEGKEVQALAIYKSENKDTFLKIFEHGESIEMIQEDGINIHKPDKACLVFKSNSSEGYRLCVIDHTNRQQDAQYWVKDYLQVQPVLNNYHHTDKYLDLCKQFATEEFPAKFVATRNEQLELMNRSMDYFKTHDAFNLEEFAGEVIHQPELIESFRDFKSNFEKARQYEMEEGFDIDLAAVKKQQKFFKSILKLDKNFHIYIHGRRDFIEKGVDESGRKFYKLYYEEEH